MTGGEEMVAMTVPTAAVRDPKGYRPPAITGLADLLDRQVRDRPAARALVVTGDRVHLSYGALAGLVDDVAARLGGTGLRRGDAVGLSSANTAEFVVALLGAARAGLVVAPIDPALPRSEISARLEALGAQAILVGPPAADAAPVAGDHVPTWTLRVDVTRPGTPTVTLDTGVRAARHVRGAAAELSDDDALVMFTAGTTDRPKMVPLTQANVAASVRSRRYWPRWPAGDASCCPSGDGSRRTRSGTTCGTRPRRGSPRSRPSTRSSWTAQLSSTQARRWRP
jgi:acyl-CoA synthetase (AMP-forming)/AMP-acid ligase II